MEPNTHEKPNFLAKYGLILFLVTLVTALHYFTPHGGHNAHLHHIDPAAAPDSPDIFGAFHGIYRRLYYFPIILAAFRGGTRLALGTSILVIIIYLPHAFASELGIGHLVMGDPGALVEKILEMMLYLAMGLVAGLLVDRLTASGNELVQTADKLQLTLDEKIAMEDALVRSARLAAVGRLSAGLAHEIRNPLASIQGSAEMLADDFPTQHPKHKLLAILLAETERLNTVLSRFLAFARSKPSKNKSFDLVHEVRAVADLIKHQHDGAVINLELPASCHVLGDADQLRQIILNLALNATAMAAPNAKVSITVTTTDTHGEIAVRDNGPGFTEEALENFGTPFYSSRQGGTGLGLATSLRLCEDMGGTLQVDTSTNQGARVVVHLPLTSTDGNGDK